MPVYQYKDKYYDIAETDPAKAKSFIQSKLGEPTGPRDLGPFGTQGQPQPPVPAPRPHQIFDPITGVVEAGLAPFGYEPRTREGKAIVGAIPEGIKETGEKILQGLGPAESALMQGPSMVGKAISVPTKALAATSAGQTLAKIPEIAGSAIRSQLDPEKLELAKKAADRGITIRPDMLTNSSVAKLLGDTLEKVPFSGAKDELRQTQFNQAIIDVIGGDATKTKLTPDVFSKAIKNSGDKIGNISSKYNIPVDQNFRTNLSNVMQNAEFETSDVSRIVNKYVNELSKHVDANGQINGETFRKVRTQLTGQMRRSKDGDLVNALSNLDDVMLDSIRGQLKPDELSEFDTARKQYAYAKTIQPLVAKGAGDISASKLMNRVTSTEAGKSAMAKGTAGDLGDIARIGQAFLNEPTTPLSKAGGVLGELGAAAVAPHTTAGVVGGANLYNRLGPNIANRLISGNAPQVPGAIAPQVRSGIPLSQSDLQLLNMLSRNQQQ